MLRYEDIRTVEIELSSFCNAACPLCPRNVFGYPYHNGFAPTNLSLEHIKKILDIEFLKQVDKILLEGNLGDFIMNPEAIDIIEYIRNANPNLLIYAVTNGSAGTEQFWKDLARLNVQVEFSIDGLEDTHSIYRRNTSWKKIIRNAELFIAADGHAVWKMIKFDHNQHQIEQCQRMSQELGFVDFILLDRGRDRGPVFDRHGNLEYILGNWQGETDLSKIMDIIERGDILLEDIDDIEKELISCQALNNRSIYVSSIGEIYPCCFMGFNPKTFGHGTWHQPVNAQIKSLARENNALLRDLKDCINWFNDIPSCWDKKGFDEGRLIVCDRHCGVKTPKNLDFFGKKSG